jgi:hypothetical protein
MSNDLVQETCEGLKRTYVELRNLRTYADVRKTHPKFDPMFMQLARAIVARKVPASEYVNWCFDTILMRHSDVYANMVCSMKLLARFCEEAPRRNKELELIVKLQARTIKQREARGEPIDRILLDEDMPVGAVMRYVAARAHGKHDLERVFRDDARREIAMRPHYAVVLKNHLPEDMKNG